MVRQVADGVVNGLKSNPLVLGLVVVNVLFIAASAWTLRSIAQAGERRDALISQLARDCVVVTPRQSP